MSCCNFSCRSPLCWATGHVCLTRMRFVIAPEQLTRYCWLLYACWTSWQWCCCSTLIQGFSIDNMLWLWAASTVVAYLQAPPRNWWESWMRRCPSLPENIWHGCTIVSIWNWGGRQCPCLSLLALLVGIRARRKYEYYIPPAFPFLDINNCITFGTTKSSWERVQLYISDLASQLSATMEFWPCLLWWPALANVLKGLIWYIEVCSRTYIWDSDACCFSYYYLEFGWVAFWWRGSQSQ